MSNDSTKQKLLDAALKLFVGQGVAETTTKDIARQAGFAEGTIYRHFRSKDDLVADLFRGHFVEFVLNLARARDEAGVGLKRKLTAMIGYMCALYDTNPTLYSFLLLKQHTALPYLHDVPLKPTSIFRQLIAEAITAGEMPNQDAALSASMLLGAIVQPAMSIIYGTLPGKMSDHANAIAGGCLALLNQKPHIAGSPS